MLPGAAAIPVAEIFDGSLWCLRLRGSGQVPSIDRPSPADLEVAAKLVEGLVQLGAGQRPDLGVPLAWDRVDGFARDVLVALQGVGWGETVTYGQLAARVGRPAAARAVGAVMAANPWPLVVPCHRVVPAAGGYGGYQGGVKLKTWLLGVEGADVQFAPKRRSNSSRAASSRR